MAYRLHAVLHPFKYYVYRKVLSRSGRLPFAQDGNRNRKFPAGLIFPGRRERAFRKRFRRRPVPRAPLRERGWRNATRESHVTMTYTLAVIDVTVFSRFVPRVHSVSHLRSSRLRSVVFPLALRLHNFSVFALIDDRFFYSFSRTLFDVLFFTLGRNNRPRFKRDDISPRIHCFNLTVLPGGLVNCLSSKYRSFFFLCIFLRIRIKLTGCDNL